MLPGERSSSGVFPGWHVQAGGGGEEKVAPLRKEISSESLSRFVGSSVTLLAQQTPHSRNPAS